MFSKTAISRQLVTLIVAFTAFGALACFCYDRALARQTAGATQLLDDSMTRLNFSLQLLSSLASTQNSLQRLLREKDPDNIEAIVTEHGLAQTRLRGLIESCGSAGQPILTNFDEWTNSSTLVIDEFLHARTADALYKFVTVTTARYEQVVASVRSFAASVQDAVRAQSAESEAAAIHLRHQMAAGACAAFAVLLTGASLFRRRIVALATRRAQLEATNAAIEAEVHRQTAELERVHKELMTTARRAGMAEVATGVLHNVGNVLNSVNVSASTIAERVRQSRVSHLVKAAGMLGEHEKDLGEFLTTDNRGRQFPTFLSQLAKHLNDENTMMSDELRSLAQNIEHIKEIVATQQAYSRAGGVIEKLPLIDLMEDALRINMAGLERHDVDLVREFVASPVLLTDKHKVLQILVNLISNAKYAMEGRGNKRLTLRIETIDDGSRVRISVTDTGVGIPPENLTRIFSHGFTTRKEGHGFGLHSSANAAKELNGSLTAQSGGPGKGATFVVELPATTEAANETPRVAA